MWSRLTSSCHRLCLGHAHIERASGRRWGEDRAVNLELRHLVVGQTLVKDLDRLDAHNGVLSAADAGVNTRAVVEEHHDIKRRRHNTARLRPRAVRRPLGLTAAVIVGRRVLVRPRADRDRVPLIGREHGRRRRAAAGVVPARALIDVEAEVSAGVDVEDARPGTVCIWIQLEDAAMVLETNIRLEGSNDTRIDDRTDCPPSNNLSLHHLLLIERDF